MSAGQLHGACCPTGRQTCATSTRQTIFRGARLGQLVALTNVRSRCISSDVKADEAPAWRCPLRNVCLICLTDCVPYLQTEAAVCGVGDGVCRWAGSNTRLHRGLASVVTGGNVALRGPTLAETLDGLVAGTQAPAGALPAEASA